MSQFWYILKEKHPPSLPTFFQNPDENLKFIFYGLIEEQKRITKFQKSYLVLQELTEREKERQRQAYREKERERERERAMTKQLLYLTLNRVFTIYLCIMHQKDLINDTFLPHSNLYLFWLVLNHGLF